MSTWETPLVARALEAAAGPPPSSSLAPVSADALREAQRHCAAVTRRNSQIVSIGAGLLRGQARPGMHALYAVVRVSDDRSESRAPDRHQAWARWRAQCLDDPRPCDPVALAWAHAARQHRVPQALAAHFFDGLERDLDPVRLERFEDLAAYCYDVACPVPLMAMFIVGGLRPEAVPYAVRLGVALQLTNNLRDVGEDLAEGRMYLPRRELAAHDLDEVDLAAGVVDDRWRAFMRMQLDRARAIYREAMPGIDLLPAVARFPTAAIAELYLRVLDDIEAHDFDVFSRRAGLSGRRKLLALPGIWLRSRARGYGPTSPPPTTLSGLPLVRRRS